ncbi:MAG TPA: ABC transporter permease [Firmicutes bacterium]|nr:ABC transporter permease [Bacillota bacterium]
MFRYTVRRLVLAIPTLIGVSVVIFSVIHLIPGDPIAMMFGREPDPEGIARVRAYYHLDRPVYIQYFLWLGGLVKGYLGSSIRFGTPVTQLIVERMPPTLALTIAGAIVSLLVAVPLGILSAARQNTSADLGLTSFSLVWLSMPDFWKGILFVLCFAVFLRIFPVGGYVPVSQGVWGFLIHLIMPAIAVGSSLGAVTMRMLRSSILEVLRQEYITVARAKGLSERVVLYRHALRNALIPTVTVVGMQIGYLLGGTIIIERVFSYPGMGMQLLSAITARDYPLIQGQLLVFAVLFVGVNLLTDLAYSIIDPKIRHS